MSMLTIVYDFGNVWLSSLLDLLVIVALMTVTVDKPGSRPGHGSRSYSVLLKKTKGRWRVVGAWFESIS